jgi:hypothetical protein
VQPAPLGDGLGVAPKLAVSKDVVCKQLSPLSIQSVSHIPVCQPDKQSNHEFHQSVQVTRLEDVERADIMLQC